MSERTSGQETGPTAPYVPQNASTGTSDDVAESEFVKWWGEYRPGQYLYDSALNVWRTARTADAERIAALEAELAEARIIFEVQVKADTHPPSCPKCLEDSLMCDELTSMIVATGRARREWLARPAGTAAARVIAAVLKDWDVLEHESEALDIAVEEYRESRS